MAEKSFTPVSLKRRSAAKVCADAQDTPSNSPSKAPNVLQGGERILHARTSGCWVVVRVGSTAARMLAHGQEQPRQQEQQEAAMRPTRAARRSAASRPTEFVGFCASQGKIQ